MIPVSQGWVTRGPRRREKKKKKKTELKARWMAIALSEYLNTCAFPLAELGWC